MTVDPWLFIVPLGFAPMVRSVPVLYGLVLASLTLAYLGG
jgi:hypothetical protein